MDDDQRLKNNKTTANGCWTLDFLVSDIKLQAIYKVIHTSNYDGHISKYVCKIGKYNQRGTIFSRYTISHIIYIYVNNMYIVEESVPFTT